MMIKYRVYILCVLTLFLTSCAHKDMELPEIVQVKKVNPYHKVSEGDTVGSIAEKYGMTRADLIKLNNLEQPYQLYEGQRLVITVKPESEEEKKLESEGVEVSDTSEKTNDIEDGVTESEKDKETLDDIKDKEETETLVIKTDYIWPVEGGKSKVTQHFDSTEVDSAIIIDASVGTPVKAIADGLVVISGIPSGEAAAYGTTVVIKHTSKKTMSIYANLKEANAIVGKKVKQGEIIGKVGKSGSIAKKPQLYFELNDLSGPGRRAVDPEKYLPK